MQNTSAGRICSGRVNGEHFVVTLRQPISHTQNDPHKAETIICKEANLSADGRILHIVGFDGVGGSFIPMLNIAGVYFKPE